MNQPHGQSHYSQPRHGFILIIVLGLLGVMAFLALEMVEKAGQSKMLSSASVLNTHTHLLARSGIERGRQEILAPYLAVPSLPLASPHPYQGVDLVVTLPIDAEGEAKVRIGNSNGKICLNDGLMAGRAELGGAYNASALDPWPAPGVQDISAWINIRLRRLLNAYGDIHKFASDMQPFSPGTGGWPRWQSAGVDPVANKDFAHTATDGAERFESLPPRLFADGSATVNSQLSAGLGDRIIGARPQSGFTHRDQVRDILNVWGAEFLSASYLAGESFSDKASRDFTFQTWHDTAFWRMKRELGCDYPLWSSQGGLGLKASLETAPPDFTDLWRPHPLPPINLNTASDAVRAAVFQAPTDMSDTVQIQMDHASAAWWKKYHIQDAYFRRFALQSVTLDTAKFENGRTLFTESLGVFSNLLSPLAPWQKRRVLSVRDAMILAQSYREMAEVGGGAPLGWPDSFERFNWHLTKAVPQTRGLERIALATLQPWYVRVLSCDRRMPEWMAAPLALMSPIAPGDFSFRSHLPKVTFLSSGRFTLESRAGLAQNRLSSRRSIITQVQAFDTRTVRDQASFRALTDPGSTADIQIGPELDDCVAAGGASKELGFIGLKDRGCGVAPSPLGCPRVRYDFNGNLSSTGNFTHQDPATDPHTQPANGAAPGFGHQELRTPGSLPVGGALSIFPRGPGVQPSSFSPFGGLFFSSFRHGLWAANRFSHSFYFRPENFLLSDRGLVIIDDTELNKDHGKAWDGSILFQPNQLWAPPLPPPPPEPTKVVGALANKGMISLWVRLPSAPISESLGFAAHPNGGNNLNSFFQRPLTVFDMTLWEKVELKQADGTTPAMLRPVNLSLHLFRGYAPINEAKPLTGTWAIRFSVSCGLGGGNTVPAGFPGYRLDPTYQNLLKPIALPWIDDAPNMTGYPFSELLFPFFKTTAPTSWRDRFTRNFVPYPSTEIREQGYSEHVFTFSEANNFRPGSWVRLVCLWDFRLPKVMTNEGIRSSVFILPHTLNNVGGYAPPLSASWSGSNHVNARSYNLFNPKMGLSFGERFYEVMPSPYRASFEDFQNQTFTGLSVVRPEDAGALVSHGDLVPEGRLNSLIDNVSMVFGDFPNGWSDIPPKAGDWRGISTGTAVRGPYWDAIQALPTFSSRRYEIRSAPGNVYEPVWVINPQLPAGSKLLQFGARIHDVPFVGTTWPVKAPRVDVGLQDALGVAVPATASSLPITHATDPTLILRSPAWSSYPLTSLANHRFTVRWRNRDVRDLEIADNEPLTDIPYLTEVSWCYVPQGGMKILSWEQE